VADRWLEAPTDDFGDLPKTHPPTGVAPMRPARPLPDDERPPNMPDWAALRRRPGPARPQ
jgi:hypothetical protein